MILVRAGVITVSFRQPLRGLVPITQAISAPAPAGPYEFCGEKGIFLAFKSFFWSVFMKSLKIALFISAIFPFNPAYAADAATVIFKSGQVIKVDDGFRQIVDVMKANGSSDKSNNLVELNIGGGTFLLNLSEVVVVCRDSCSNLTILHQLDPKRGGYKTNVTIDQSRNALNPPSN